jgi:hypothetical protein
MGCRDDYVGLTADVLQKAADLLRRPTAAALGHKRSSIRQRFCSLARVFDKKLRDWT